MPSASQKAVCADCAVSTEDIVEVRRRNLCPSCFQRYVYSKILKRMVSYRFKEQVGNHRPKLLLPVSGGPSSLVLLHSLDAQLKKQQQRTAYDLVLVHVRSVEPDEPDRKWREAVQARFVDHKMLPILELHDIFQYDNTIEEDLQNLGLNRTNGEDSIALVTRLFTSAKTATAKSDLWDLLLQRLLVAVAKKHECESILWGHSNSRLAAKALADVAKGRGGSVPNLTTDGPSPLGIDFNYPVRELYTVELSLYIQTQLEDMSQCLIEQDADPAAPVSIRNTSIDALLTGYIASQGQKYPSIVANVVRTTGKLQVNHAVDAQKCKLCSIPGTFNLAGCILCYGCQRTMQDIKI